MRPTPSPLSLSGIAAAVSVMALLAACASNDQPSPPATEPPPATTTTSAPATSPTDQGQGQTVEVKMNEFALELPATFKPGTYTFVAENTGQAPHALEIEGQGIEEETPVVQPGESAELTVTLREGTYEFYCPVGNHRGMGMTKEVTVG